MECYQTLPGMAKNFLVAECGLALKDGKRGSNETERDRKRYKASGIGSDVVDQVTAIFSARRNV